MQIIIPMSGFGERFKKAGYTKPKPLIEVDGAPIISYIINLFPGETRFLFICNETHLANPEFAMAETIQHYCPTGKIVSIAPQKLGPIQAVLDATDYIDEEDEAIVNYCDFTCDWNYAHFKSWIHSTKPDGCVPAYRGFHPHSLGSTYYAYIKEQNGQIQDIQEKQPFTDTPMQEFASSGTYYFRHGKLLKHYFKETIKQDLKVNNEFYVSMAYKPMLQDKLKISVYELNHFMQWGTPQDLQEYLYWSTLFKLMSTYEKPTELDPNLQLLMPMIGKGSRFEKSGYSTIKPLIPVLNKPMYQQAMEMLPKAKNVFFTLRKDMNGYEKLTHNIKTHFPSSQTISTDTITNGQATSCMLAEKYWRPNEPLLIAACDNGVIYDQEKYRALVNDNDIDIIVWGIKHYPNAGRYPDMYGWVKTEKNSTLITAISVKKPFDLLNNDAIIIGTFTFKKAADFSRCYKKMLAENDKINDEFYVDSCINHAIQLGLKCAMFEVDAYLCFGTPNDLKTFEYWQNCFRAWPYHPYEEKECCTHE